MQSSYNLVMLSFLLSNVIYMTAVILFCCGLFIVISSDHYVKKIIGLGIFQSSVLLFFIALGKLAGGRVPIAPSGVSEGEILFSSPLPHVLMLTAIVVGFATTAVALALALRVKQEHNTLSSSAIAELMDQ